MERLEQIVEASKANIKKWEVEIFNVYDRHAGFIEGAEWADKTMIENACEWLENEFSVDDYFDDTDSWGTDIFNYDRFINDFKKAMEGGDE